MGLLAASVHSVFTVRKRPTRECGLASWSWLTIRFLFQRNFQGVFLLLLFFRCHNPQHPACCFLIIRYRFIKIYINTKKRCRHLNYVLTLLTLVFDNKLSVLADSAVNRSPKLCLCLCHGGHFHHKRILCVTEHSTGLSLFENPVCIWVRIKLNMLVLLQYSFQSKKSSFFLLQCSLLRKFYFFCIPQPSLKACLYTVDRVNASMNSPEDQSLPRWHSPRRHIRSDDCAPCRPVRFCSTSLPVCLLLAPYILNETTLLSSSGMKTHCEISSFDVRRAF